MKSLAPITLLTALAALTMLPARAQDLLVGDYYTNEIWRVAPNGTKTLFANPGVPSGIRLCGFSFDSGGNLYAARLQGATANAGDPNNGIIKISPNGAVTDFAFNVPGLPTDTAVDSAGNIYVASQTNGQVRRFSSAGVDLGVFATVSGEAYNIDFDSSGNLYVASVGSGQIRRFSSTGTDLGIFATVSSASSLAFNSGGDLFVGTNNGVIRRISSSGTDLGVFGSTPGALFDGLAFSSNGELFAANYQLSNGNIQRFSSTGTPLGAFSSGINAPFGMGFVPAIVPEASSLLLALPALAIVGRIARRKSAKE